MNISTLHGDPPCSIIEGNIMNNEISFKANVPIYNQQYIFSGTVTEKELSGQLNRSNAQLKLSQFQYTPKDKNQWCSNWAEVQGCSGVKEYCK